MTVTPKSINLFLMDGRPDGRIKCTIANWTGLAYKIPRTDLEKCMDRDDLKQTGVYFLMGESDLTENPMVYIGQAGIRKNGEGILYRLREHKRNPNKDYWIDAVVFTTSNDSFGPTEISYLENQFFNMARSTGRYDVQNGNDPTPGNITEEKECEMKEFIDYSKIIMGVLGYKVFIPYTMSDECVDIIEPIIMEPLFFLKHKNKRNNQITEARCKQTREGFVILKGSQIETMDSPSLPPGIREIRHKAKMENDILQEDILFNTPSAAASFVIGTSANGRSLWKTAEGKSLNDCENENIEN